MWRWSADNDDEKYVANAEQPSLNGLLEFYFCGLFEQIELTRSLNIWCDGVIDLRIRELSRYAFLVGGAAYCPSILAPFEFECHHKNSRDLLPTYEIFRFGLLDKYGKLQLGKFSPKPEKNKDWAVAVRLTNEG